MKLRPDRTGDAPMGNIVTVRLGMSDEDFLNCKGMQERRYTVVVSGDGPVQTYREGIRHGSSAGDFRYCVPALARLGSSDAHAYVTGCASRSDPTRACLKADENGGVYVDRTGTKWELRVISFDASDESADAVRGVLRADAGRGSGELNLEVQFHVARDMPALAEHLSPYFHPELASQQRSAR